MNPDLLPDFEAATLEEGRRLFAGSCTFMKGVVSMDGLPPMDLPEVCFAGRSNVGKSSLINAVTGHKNLARASNTPGRTQELNFFNLSDQVFLCDLPGYGFAQAPKDKVEKWTRLVKTYLRGRANLRRVFLLIDSRHGLKQVDLDIMKMLDESAVSYQVILTKADKLKKNELDKCVADTAAKVAKHVAAHPVLLPTSAEKGYGIPEVRAAVYELSR